MNSSGDCKVTDGMKHGPHWDLGGSGKQGSCTALVNCHDPYSGQTGPIECAMPPEIGINTSHNMVQQWRHRPRRQHVQCPANALPKLTKWCHSSKLQPVWNCDITSSASNPGMSWSAAPRSYVMHCNNLLMMVTAWCLKRLLLAVVQYSIWVLVIAILATQAYTTHHLRACRLCEVRLWPYTLHHVHNSWVVACQRVVTTYYV